MDFTHNEDRKMLSEMAQRFVRENYTLEARHELTKSELGYDDKNWQKFAELGLIGALFDEQSGGYGGNPYDIMVVFEALGKGLVVEPFLPTLLAGKILSSTAKNLDTLQAVISGEQKIALAHFERDGRYDFKHVSLKAEQSGDGYVLTGEKNIALNANGADHLVVSARLSGGTQDQNGIGLFLVPANSAGLSLRNYPTVDGYNASEITFEGVKLGADNLLTTEGYAHLESAIAYGNLALSCEAVCIAEMAIEITREYLMTRKQFGAPLGAFQALQHRMAELLIEADHLRSATINAAGHFNEDRVEREWYISAAKVLTGQVGKRIAEESIQMHGGIGMTWEYSIGHYAKRLTLIDHNLGDQDFHLERIMELSKLRN